MATTQSFLPIQEVKDDVAILKDGSMAVVLQTNAVNFGLLSENEQLAIISAFAALLNSLSFSIQIVIRSKRLDISSYLNLLAQAQKSQTNALLSRLMANYRDFIEKIVRENQVLDKQFYIIIPLGYLEVGLLRNVEGNFKKALTLLLPRRDHIIRQLWRTGLKATQLNSKQLIELYFDIYNSPRVGITPAIQPAKQTVAQEVAVPKLQPQPEQKQVPEAPAQPAIAQPVAPPTQAPVQPAPRSANLATPFVVEELADDYGTV